MSKQTAIASFSDEQDLKKVLATQYMKQIENLFGDKDKALEFLTNVVSTMNRIPKLWDCTRDSLINSFLTLAALKFMPSAISGEAYILPYEDKKNGVTIAQFQLGYQGLVTLLYRAGNKSVVAELVRQGDKFTMKNGKVRHEIDPTKNAKERGKIQGAYSIITLVSGDTIDTFMHIDDIYEHAKRFSKSFASSFSPWNLESDPQGWMLRKTVLKQNTKLAPKNPELEKAIAEDNKDSVISDKQESRAIEAPQEVEVDAELVTQWEKMVRGCTTLDQLKEVWADCPASVRKVLESVKEEIKAMIMSEIGAAI